METPSTETPAADPAVATNGKKSAKATKPIKKAKVPSAKGGGTGTGVRGSAAPAARADGPRAGSMGALVVEKTRLGWGVEAIARAAAAAFPKTARAKEFRDGDYYGIVWLQGHARKNGWLPKAK